MSSTSKIKIDLDQIDEANIHLTGARAMLRIIEIASFEGALDDISNSVISDAIHGIGLMLETTYGALNGGDE